MPVNETVPGELAALISYPLVFTSSVPLVDPVLNVTQPATPALSLSKNPIARLEPLVSRLLSMSSTTSPLTGNPISFH